MSVKNPTIPTKIDPQPLDVALAEVGTKLREKLTWLNNTYGKVERLVRMDGKKRVKYPAIYVAGRNGEDYLSMLPDDHLKNYMYCDVTKEEVDHKPRQSRDGKIEVDFVFHWSYKKVYGANHKGVTIENVKKDIFEAFDKSIFANSRIRVLGFKEGANNIYGAYTHEEIKHQFLMRPFGSVALKAIFYYDQTC